MGLAYRISSYLRAQYKTFLKLNRNVFNYKFFLFRQENSFLEKFVSEHTKNALSFEVHLPRDLLDTVFIKRYLCSTVG